jgi:cytochrome P450
VFDDPDRFRPEREEKDVLTFGFGPKYCPGVNLARRQLSAALDVVLERLPGLRLVGPAAPSGAILRSVKSLRVAWSQPSSSQA